MENIYILSDFTICEKIGKKIKDCRLRQNISQLNLAQDAQVSISTIKKMEAGNIGSFDSFIRIIRVLGLLEILEPLTKEDELSPNDYYELVNSIKKKKRKRASKTTNKISNKEISEW